ICPNCSPEVESPGRCLRRLRSQIDDCHLKWISFLSRSNKLVERRPGTIFAHTSQSPRAKITHQHIRGVGLIIDYEDANVSQDLSRRNRPASYARAVERHPKPECGPLALFAFDTHLAIH